MQFTKTEQAPGIQLGQMGRKGAASSHLRPLGLPTSILSVLSDFVRQTIKIVSFSQQRRFTEKGVYSARGKFGVSKDGGRGTVGVRF
jgi:hypothetical protein